MFSELDAGEESLRKARRQLGVHRQSLLKQAFEGKQCARVLPPGSILVTCIGAAIGKTGLAQVTCATNQQINSISPGEDTMPVFAYYQVISPAFQDQIKTNASSTTLPILDKSKFSALSIARCSLPEQREIVRLLDSQFTVIEQNEREIDTALKCCAALRQSILKKAFTGQLIAQDPTDEPASALLERIREERKKEPLNAKKRAT